VPLIFWRHPLPKERTVPRLETIMAASAAPAVDASSVAADQLKSFIERIERLEEEKAGLANDIKDVYAEAKGTGFQLPPAFVISQCHQSFRWARAA